ncbi:hypothetical protein I3843_12G135500 [Carya illinoinensis]|uniref:Pectinesterase n=1 Tax=Carya illinoinensis TaxID=32201 RepID=A0A8T1NX35_CARIL|nr:pectinesterase QRT1-like [Carya illinoinensis]KAG2678218.1 hypothetical protein I3760_12G133300 [Carya illinoinensis]KAG6634718.1 hypothetical protein CIPAW_12G136500 [Carya illinoinensis]KAG6685900.1 hypothetical protein I3842_12G135200 [Carya illinoinensis]KAG7953940.1 hypothetical protein I3843_12G135500 [Carya illinoinensis]
MGLSVFRATFLVVFLVGIQEISSVEGDVYGTDYISWDDLKVDEKKVAAGLTVGDEQGQILVVDKNGRGDSLTVQGAVDMVPENNTQRVKIYVLPGIYREKVFVPSSKPYVSLIGNQNGMSDTIVTWNNKASDEDSDGVQLGTSGSASVAIESDYFCATGITFENTVVAVPGGYGMQAVALRIAGDKAVFYRVRILGTQDTLLDDTGSHYFYQCHIQGSVDFIFGRSRSLYQDCVIQSTAKNWGSIAAHHRDLPDENTGFSFVNCKITGTGSILLGRAWGDYSRVVYSQCNMDDIITPSGWSDWKQPSRQKTVVFGEYQCRGRGADKRGRVPWLKSFSYEEVRPFQDKTFISGEQWIRL